MERPSRVVTQKAERTSSRRGWFPTVAIVQTRPLHGALSVSTAMSHAPTPPDRNATSQKAQVTGVDSATALRSHDRVLATNSGRVPDCGQCAPETVSWVIGGRCRLGRTARSRWGLLTLPGFAPE